jgi:murein DD-endopeptidase MepM/ murein hydrolase activator NlpD
MFSPSHRAVAHVIIAGLIAMVVVLSLAPPAGATEPDDQASNEIVFEVFPHVGAASNFWNSWGARRSGGRRHKGVDILGQRGAPVVAVADGVVAEMGKSRLSGYFIRIQHAGDWMTVVMHLNNDTFGTDDGEGGTWTAFFPTLMVGDEVTAGQVIGYIGDSGNAEDTTPHTHFELRYEGKKINPYPYLVDAWRRHFRLPLPTGSAEAL